MSSSASNDTVQTIYCGMSVFGCDSHACSNMLQTCYDVETVLTEARLCLLPLCALTAVVFDQSLKHRRLLLQRRMSAGCLQSNGAHTPIA
jgi:hypothetical protein